MMQRSGLMQRMVHTLQVAMYKIGRVSKKMDSEETGKSDFTPPAHPSSSPGDEEEEEGEGCLRGALHLRPTIRHHSFTLARTTR